MKTKKQIEAEGFKITFTNGTGAGGQKRNRTLSVAVVEHISSGESQRCDETRNRDKNMNIAYQKILSALTVNNKIKLEDRLNQRRKEALEKGTIRTYDFKRKKVKNHITKQEAPLKDVLNGKLELINSPL